MLIIKYIFSIIFIYITLLFISLYFYFNNFTKDIVFQESITRNLEFKNFKIKLNKAILNNQYEKTLLLLDNLTSNNKFTYVKLEYLNYYISNQSIIKHSNKPIDISWQLNDVTIDVSQGFLHSISSSEYFFRPSKIFNINKNKLIIKAQAENQITTKNILSRITFFLPEYSNDNIMKNDYIIDKLKKYIKIQNNELKSIVYIYNDEVLSVFYKYNNNYIYSLVKSKLENILIYFTIIYFVIIIFLIIINYIMIKNNINNYLKILKNYTNDILNNNFYKFDSGQLHYKDIKVISNDITAISKKMANLINEINVNRNQLELKVSTDGLTGLPNNKIFQADIKNLFLNKINAYIVKIKLLYMAEYSNKHSINDTNNLVLSFVGKINTILKENTNYTISVYRIYGSEFTLIVNHIIFKDMNILLEKLSNEIVTLKDEYSVDKKIAHLCSIPLDYYGNMNSILEKLDETFNKTVHIPKQISFYNEDNKKLTEKNNKLSKIIRSIIDNSSFTLSYKYDTYNYNSNKLIMKEVSPNLIDLEGNVIPIGTFVTVASDLKLAINFDKDVIEKSFKFIKNSNLDYKLAINLSIDSIKDPNFITWLESKLLYDYEDIKTNIIFSITSFVIKNNFDDFVNFSNNIKVFGAKIIIKRFNFNDLTFDQLEKINVDYIRVHSDYTNILDKAKENILRNISDFSIANNIKIYADMVNSENTHQVLKSINFDGASKEVKN